MCLTRMLLGPLIRSWGTRQVSPTLTLLHEPMAVAARSWPSRCGCLALPGCSDVGVRGPQASSSSLCLPPHPTAAGIRATLWGASSPSPEDEEEQTGPEQGHREWGYWSGWAGLGWGRAWGPWAQWGLGWSPIPPYRPTVFTVLLHLKNELNRGDFFMTLRNQPMALSLYRQVCAGARWGGACGAPKLALLTAHLLSPVL